MPVPPPRPFPLFSLAVSTVVTLHAGYTVKNNVLHFTGSMPVMVDVAIPLSAKMPLAFLEQAKDLLIDPSWVRAVNGEIAKRKAAPADKVVKKMHTLSLKKTGGAAAQITKAAEKKKDTTAEKKKEKKDKEKKDAAMEKEKDAAVEKEKEKEKEKDAAVEKEKNKEKKDVAVEKEKDKDKEDDNPVEDMDMDKAAAPPADKDEPKSTRKRPAEAPADNHKGAKAAKTTTESTPHNVLSNATETEARAKLKEHYGIEPNWSCLLYTSPSPRDGLLSRMPSSA